jgi:Holliday junction resolvase RusA-like endonuclease
VATIALIPTSLTVDLPLPPSVNELTVNLKNGGRAKSAKYKAWIEESRWHVMMAWRSAGKPTWPDAPLAVTLELGLEGRIRDAGNCLKAVEDLLVKNLPVPDDRWNDDIRIIRNETIAGRARVTIASLAPG